MIVSVLLFLVGVVLIGLALYDHARILGTPVVYNRDNWSRMMIEIALGSALLVAAKVIL
jgi:hypothetical protein